MDKLDQQNFYHIYNRGNSGENIFYKPENYLYFLQKYDFHLSGYLDTYAFCLIPNHFHFLVRVKDFSNLNLVKDSFPKDIAPIISQQFRKLFVGYSLAINRQQKRHGSLFEKPFKRKLITDNSYLFRVIRYIHSNPVHHNLVDKLEDWSFSSYAKILNPRKSKLKKEEVLEFFSDKENYIKQHKEKEDLDLIERFIIE